MRVLVTGAGGFVGRHLTPYMAGLGHEVICCVHDTIADSVSLPEALQIIPINLIDYDSVLNAIQTAKPEWIMHLAAVSYLPESFLHGLDAWRTNLFGTLHLFEAARQTNIQERVLFISSAAVYGKVTEDQVPLVETEPMNPAEPYGASKAACELAAMQYSQSFGLAIVRSRSFNHTGPGQPHAFVCSEFARTIAMAEAGTIPPILNVGNLRARRDITDVRDVVRAYAELIEKGKAGEVYNVASGRDIAISRVLDMLLGMSGVEMEVRVAYEKIRPVELPVVVGDPTKIREAIGWEPKIPIEQTLLDTLNWWRQKVADGES